MLCAQLGFHHYRVLLSSLEWEKSSRLPTHVSFEQFNVVYTWQNSLSVGYAISCQVPFLPVINDICPRFSDNGLI